MSKGYGAGRAWGKEKSTGITRVGVRLLTVAAALRVVDQDPDVPVAGIDHPPFMRAFGYDTTGALIGSAQVSDIAMSPVETKGGASAHENTLTPVGGEGGAQCGALGG